jgi:hypothetical protein
MVFWDMMPCNPAYKLFEEPSSFSLYKLTPPKLKNAITQRTTILIAVKGSM